MAHEKLELFYPAPNGGPSSAFTSERLGEINAQLPNLLRHHTLLHNAVLVIYISIGLFLLCMFAIAVAAAAPGLLFMPAVVLATFLGGTLALFSGVVIAIGEVRSSHSAVQFETKRVIALRSSLKQ